MLNKFRNYIYLRSKGVSIKNSIRELSGIGDTMKYVLTLILCVLAAFLIWLYQVEIDSYEINLKLDALQQKMKAMEAYNKVSNYEKMVLNCLNGNDLLVDGENRPCKVGRYEDGKVKI